MVWTNETVAMLRRETAGLANSASGSSVLHFNNAGCSLPPRQVLDAVMDHLRLEATVGGYEALAQPQAAEAMQRPYTTLARLLNCRTDEIAIVPSATVAWQQVVYGLAWEWKTGDRLLTSVAEYGSNYIAYLQLSKRTGVQVQVIPETPEGDIDIAALERLVTEGERPPVLITITHVPTSSGRVYDAVAVGRVARQHGILYMLDACQSVGQMPIDVQEIGCHFLSATGRKYLRGPRGSGFLFCSREALDRFEPAAVDSVGATWVAEDRYELQPSAKRFESYEMTMAAKAGLGMAVDYCLLLGIQDIWQRILQLSGQLRAGLAALPRVTIHDKGRVLCGLVSFTVAGLQAEGVRLALAQRRINVSVSAVGSSRLDFQARGLEAVVRASLHYYNSEAEVEQLIRAVDQL